MDENIRIEAQIISSAPPNIEGKILAWVHSSEVAVTNQNPAIEKQNTSKPYLPLELVTMIFDHVLDKKNDGA
jgi:hypothetical protein